MDEKLLFKYFRGETTSEEEDAILAWVEETPANRKEFKTAFMIFSGLAVYAANPNAMPTAAPQRRRIWRQVVRYSLRSAAAVILMIGAAYTGKTLYRNALSQQNMSIVVPAGQQMSLTLPDNSQVQLNSGTRLEYPVVFVVDANEGIVPHHKAGLPADIEEERRLFYVALTRAKDRLHVAAVKERYHRKTDVSRFVEEAGL